MIGQAQPIITGSPGTFMAKMNVPMMLKSEDKPKVATKHYAQLVPLQKFEMQMQECHVDLFILLIFKSFVQTKLQKRALSLQIDSGETPASMSGIRNFFG